MYLHYYGFKEKPFKLTPDPKYLFLSERHREALAHLLYGIQEGEGFIEVTGEVGTGKTILCRTLLQELDPNTSVAFIFNPSLSATELLKTINDEFGIPASSPSKKELIDVLNQHLLDENRRGRKMLVIIDEAQNLRPAVLEQLRLISNLETNSQKLLQIILIGQPELERMLRRPNLRQLNQRITVRCRLGPLSFRETVGYIEHRLGVASGLHKVSFSARALHMLYRKARGIPRSINILADRALLVGYTLGRREIDRGLMRRASREVTGAPPGLERIRHIAPLPLAATALGLAAILFLAFLALPQTHRLFYGPVDVARKVSNDLSRLARESSSAASSWFAGRLGREQREQKERAPEPNLQSEEASPLSAHLGGAPALSIAPANPPEAERPEDLAAGAEHLAAALRSADSRASLVVAANGVFALWNEPPLSEEESKDNAVTGLANKRGLSVSFFQGSLTALRHLNVPAILSLRLRGEREIRYLALTGTDGETGLVSLDPIRRIRLSALSDIWYGEAFIPFRDFEPLDPVIRPGATGDGVGWLQRALRRLGHYNGPETSVYDVKTIRAVSDFQWRHDLRSDGTVGPQTKIALYAALGDYQIPVLEGNRHDGGRP